MFTHEVIIAEVSLVSMGDNEVLPTLLNPLRPKIQQINTDGTYDTRACHHVLKNKKIKPAIPPRSKAGYWEEGHPRNGQSHKKRYAYSPADKLRL